MVITTRFQVEALNNKWLLVGNRVIISARMFSIYVLSIQKKQRTNLFLHRNPAIHMEGTITSYVIPAGQLCILKEELG